MTPDSDTPDESVASGPSTSDNAGFPKFTTCDVLPVGVHASSVEAIEDNLVSAFSGSESRQEIFNGFTKWRDEASESAIVGLQWVDGSFVENKHEPNDVDVVTFVDHELLNKLSVRSNTFIDRWMKSPRAQDRYRVDPALFPCCKPGHHFYELFEEKRQKYRKLYGHRKSDDRPKGFLSVPLGDPKQTPEVDTDLK